jgi:hypothetical protein
MSQDLNQTHPSDHPEASVIYKGDAKPGKVTSSQFAKPWLRKAVQTLLKNHTEMRDSDEHLCTEVWMIQMRHIQSKHLKPVEFFTLYKSGALASAEAIGRARRLLQQHHPELRGETWDVRHGKSKEVRDQIRQGAQL